MTIFSHCFAQSNWATSIGQQPPKWSRNILRTSPLGCCNWAKASISSSSASDRSNACCSNSAKPIPIVRTWLWMDFSPHWRLRIYWMRSALTLWRSARTLAPITKSSMPLQPHSSGRRTRTSSLWFTTSTDRCCAKPKTNTFSVAWPKYPTSICWRQSITSMRHSCGTRHVWATTISYGTTAPPWCPTQTKRRSRIPCSCKTPVNSIWLPWTMCSNHWPRMRVASTCCWLNRTWRTENTPTSKVGGLDAQLYSSSTSYLIVVVLQEWHSRICITRVASDSWSVLIWLCERNWTSSSTTTWPNGREASTTLSSLPFQSMHTF